MIISHKVRFIFSIISSLLIFTAWFPLQTSAQVRFENPEVFNTLDGLPSNHITALAKDQEGFIWIGTKQGLSRYDGAVVENFFHDEENENSLKNNEILDVLADSKNGKIWVAHAYGLSAYDPIKKVFKNYYHDPKNPHSIPGHRAYRIFKDRAETIWIGFQAGGILRYRPETDDFERFLCFDEQTQSFYPICDNGVGNIQEDIHNDSILWLGTHFGIFEFNKYTGDHELYHFEFEDTKLENYINSIRSLLVHPNGKIYLGTWYEGVTVFDIKTKSFARLDPCYKEGNSPFLKDVTDKFYLKSKNEFWVTSEKGLQLYDITSGCITQSFKNDKKKTYRVDYIDESGKVWNATKSQGLLVYNPLFQQSTSIDYELPNSKFNPFANKILEDTSRNLLLIAAEESCGLYIVDRSNGNLKCIPPPIDYDMDEYQGFKAKDMIYLEDGAVLIVEDANLFWYKPGFERLQKYPVKFSLTAPRLRKIIRDQDGFYWISSFVYGLTKLDTKTNKLYFFDDRLDKIGHRLGGDFLTEDNDGNIWLREHNGLLIYDKENDDFIYHSQNRSSANAFRSMGAIQADDKGNIWIAGRKDFMCHARSDSLQKGILQFFRKKDGLKGRSISLVKPHKGKLLVFSDFGLQVFNPANKKFEKHFDDDFGVGKKVSTATLLSDGFLAIAQEKSILLLHPDSLKINAEKPLPYVSGFSVFDKTMKLKGLPSQADTVFLSYKQNFFSFDISSIAYNQPKQTMLRYQLEGFDNSWQDGTKRRFASYTNVPGGDYRFIIEAVNDQGISLGEPSVTYLHISTVWWKTIWFWSLALIFISAITYFIYKWRIAQVRKEEQVKTDYERELADVKMSALRAQMNPHFIFNSLNSIEFYIINNEQVTAVDYLGRFSRLIRLILQNSKSSKIPIKDELEALKIYMEMESMRFDNLFDYEVKMETGVDIEQIEVPPMVIQPYVENAIWHGLMQKKTGKGKIDLTLRQHKQSIICLIEDNGIGREASAKLKSKSGSKRKSFGMKITSDRLEMLNKLAGTDASVQIFDLKDDDGSASGTRVELVIPL